MFDMSLGEMLVIGVLVLVFFSPEQLPDLMRQAGRWYGKVRGASDDLRRAFNTEVARVEADRRREELLRRREELARRRAQAEAPGPAPDAVSRPPLRAAPPVSEADLPREAAGGAPRGRETKPADGPEETP